jgi:hypothetical protein
MSETSPTPPTPPPATPRSRGYFNQAQLDDIALAESIETVARQDAAAMEEQDITPAYLDGLADVITEARNRASDSGQSGEDSKEATAVMKKSAATLLAALQKIQCSAKQKHKMLDEDGDPTTNFSTAGYLIGTRLDASRSTFLQSAATLIIRIKEDSLPGFKTPEKITAVETLRDAYDRDSGGHQESTRDKELARLTRDDLMHVLNTRRASIQHAADAIWPASDENNRPIRKTYAIPLNRMMGL